MRKLVSAIVLSVALCAEAASAEPDTRLTAGESYPQKYPEVCLERSVPWTVIALRCSDKAAQVYGEYVFFDKHQVGGLASAMCVLNTFPATLEYLRPQVVHGFLCAKLCKGDSCHFYYLPIPSPGVAD